MKGKSNYIRSSFLWGTTSKLFDAVVKFVSVPLLLAYFGRNDFGLIALATSINAYLQILDMGVNTGSIKFFSEWISKKEFKILDAVARSSLTFYGLIGLINTVVLILIAFFGLNIFSFANIESKEVFKELLLILAFFTTINWVSTVFNQLLTANENISYIQKINIFKSLFSLAIVYLTLHLQFTIPQYFLLLILINALVIIPLFIKAKSSALISSFKPIMDWVHFKPILTYSLAIIVMGIFQMTATKMRPIVLSIFSNEGTGLISDYRVMETITIFIISIGGMFVSILLPRTSKLLLEGNQEKIANFAYEKTLYTSIVCILLCFPFFLNSKEIITVYVGQEFAHLHVWLDIWIITILFYLHNSPVASLVLASGKTNMLVYSSAIACIVSLVINAILAPTLAVGSAIIGYTVYILIQMSFYYFYFNNKVLGLNSFKVFKSFIMPALLGFFALFLVTILNLEINIFLRIFFKSLIWFVIFISLLLVTKIIDINKIKINVINKSG